MSNEVNVIEEATSKVTNALKGLHVMCLNANSFDPIIEVPVVYKDKINLLNSLRNQSPFEKTVPIIGVNIFKVITHRPFINSMVEDATIIYDVNILARFQNEIDRIIKEISTNKDLGEILCKENSQSFGGTTEYNFEYLPTDDTSNVRIIMHTQVFDKVKFINTLNIFNENEEIKPKNEKQRRKKK